MTKYSVLASDEPQPNDTSTMDDVLKHRLGISAKKLSVDRQGLARLFRLGLFEELDRRRLVASAMNVQNKDDDWVG